jgi:hypothetical protein
MIELDFICDGCGRFDKIPLISFCVLERISEMMEMDNDLYCQECLVNGRYDDEE